MKPAHKKLLVAAMLVLVFGPVLLVQGLRGLVFLSVCGDIKQEGDPLIARIEAYKAQHSHYPDRETINRTLPESSQLSYWRRDDGSYRIDLYFWFDPIATYNSKDGSWSHMYDTIYQCGEVRPTP